MEFKYLIAGILTFAIGIGIANLINMSKLGLLGIIFLLFGFRDFISNGESYKKILGD